MRANRNLFLPSRLQLKTAKKGQVAFYYFNILLLAALSWKFQQSDSNAISHYVTQISRRAIFVHNLPFVSNTQRRAKLNVSQI